jgi:glycosyltransferase involved in cell wall biosynthesis
MKITFLLPTDDLTGGNRVVATYARLLQERGHEVLVVINGPRRFTLREKWRALRHGYRDKLRELSRPRPGHVSMSGVAFKRLERHRPIVADDLADADFVVATWWETAAWMEGLPASKGCQVHLIQGYETWTGDATRDQVKRALRLPNLKIAISQGLRQQIEADLGTLAIQVVPNAVDTVQFDSPPRTRSSIPTVGYIYLHDPIKGSDLCAQAVWLARERLPGLRVLAFGSEGPRDASEFMPGTEFVLRPRQDELAGLYARCDAWLFASRVDSFGLPILEAMACRTPVIGVPVGAAPDLLAGGAGVLVPPESPEAMAEAIVRLCTGPESDWQAMSDLAYQRAHGYSWDDACDRLLGVLAKAGPAEAADSARINEREGGPA